ncbi:MAG: tetratricopeptide repeat protein [Planctomycetota bacterium]|jgi:tetratricopeptide (TPR) repeat protein
MKLIAEACVAFEHDINLFVDHELPEGDGPRLVEHLEACASCSAYLDDLRELAGVHRTLEADGDADAALAAVVDKHALFASITRTLVVDKRTELARLFYELGKAYVLAANRATAESQARSVLTVRKPVDIRSASEEGRRLAREGEALCAATPTHEASGRATGSLFRRSRRLFSASARAGAGALANGHRLLQEALTLRPDMDEARLYLGFHHMLCGRYDRARIEFRRVYRQGADPIHKMMALQFLGNVYSTQGDYGHAIECYQEVVSSGLIETEPRFFTSLVNLAVSCAKAGYGTRCVQLFTDVVSRFPARLDQVKTLLSRKEGFRALLQQQSTLHDALRREVPALFAA